jgi:hypothetical protein
MNIRLPLALFTAILLNACASSPDKMQAAYVSPMKYKDYDCDQIATEMEYVSQRTTRLHQKLKKENTADKWQMGVGLILFWPVLFALEGGDGPEAAEYSQLKGEFEALRTTSTQKKCGYNYSSFEKTITSHEKEGANNPSDSTTSLDSQPVSSLRIVETTNSTLSVELPASAYQCSAPNEPGAIPGNAKSEEFITARNQVVEFQKQNGMYQECLKKSLQSAGVTEGNKRAVTLAHNMSVTVEESLVNQFNTAYDNYKVGH